MTDEELIERLRERAAEERIIQKNNEAVAAALMGQRLLFDQGVHSASNSFAVRLGLEHENCAKNDAALAHDWDAAADRIERLEAALREIESIDVHSGGEIHGVTALQWELAFAHAQDVAREALKGDDHV